LVKTQEINFLLKAEVAISLLGRIFNPFQRILAFSPNFNSGLEDYHLSIDFYDGGTVLVDDIL
jgi:hypothetical protein